MVMVAGAGELGTEIRGAATTGAGRFTAAKVCGLAASCRAGARSTELANPIGRGEALTSPDGATEARNAPVKCCSDCGAGLVMRIGRSLAASALDRSGMEAFACISGGAAATSIADGFAVEVATSWAFGVADA